MSEIPGMGVPVDRTAGSSPERAGNVLFIKAMSVAVVALSVSATILIAAYVSFFAVPTGNPGTASKSEGQRRTISGSDLIVRLGAGVAGDDKSVTLNSLAQDGTEEGRAVLTRNTRLQAAAYPFLEYRIGNSHPGEVIYLIWRTAEAPDQLSNTRLYPRPGKVTTLNLAGHKSWRGAISEIGLDIYGDLRDRPLKIAELTLAPYSANARLATLWSEWTGFESWNHSSINFLRGTASGTLVSPNAATAAWCGLALLLLAIISRRRAIHVISYVAAALIPWIALDCLWQYRLSTQLVETKNLFAGKSQYEKHLADSDGDLYRYAQHLKKQVLPPPGPRLFILRDNEGERHDYQRLRVQFHLLPHNIFNYGSEPPKKPMRSGDYILALGAIEGLRFNAQQDTLEWGQGLTLPVTQIDKHKLGDLYRVAGGRAP